LILIDPILRLSMKKEDRKREREIKIKRDRLFTTCASFINKL